MGVRVVFKLHDELEGVWYEDAFGKLGTYLILQKAVPARFTRPGLYRLRAIVGTLDPEQENAIPMPVEIGADEPEAVIE